MHKEERRYLERRAEEELASAQSATDPAVVKAHYTMLDLYLGRLFPDGNIPPSASRRWAAQVEDIAALS